MRPVSLKRQRENRARRKILAEVFESQGYCCARCLRRAPLDGHELARRSQVPGSQNIQALVVGLCRRCHQWVTENPQAAHDQGWAMWGWEYRKELP